MFYAVRRGRKIGVYNTWDECQEQVNKYQYARFKKFATKREAWAFINEEATESSIYSTGFGEKQNSHRHYNYKATYESSYTRPYKRPYEVFSERKRTNKRVKYTDVPYTPSANKNEFVYSVGCSSNGRQAARAGTGVYWGPGHPLSGALGTGGDMFYAVRRGRKIGVYNTWDECKEQVNKYQYASYKKFATEKEAWAFINEEATESSISSTGFGEKQNSQATYQSSYTRPYKRPYEVFSERKCTNKRVKYTDVPYTPSANKNEFVYSGDYIVVYTDGCCSSNGRQAARAGTGVYWGPGHPLNNSERLFGRQTNQRAEIIAACIAIEQAKSQNIRKLAIYTDSKFTINGVTSWIPNWKSNGWKTSAGKEVTNRADFERLAKLSEGMDIQWMHVPGHAGFPGNEAADRLAKQGAGKPLF